MIAGVIVMWYGNPANIPSGWLVCDGTEGTVDLRDRFAAGASSFDGVPKTAVTGAPLASGGSQIHSHEIVAGSGIADGTDYETETAQQYHLPPFAAVYFIQKV